ncbi:MAG: ABC transporter ATP-binding protein [Bacteroidales bacterium]|nr:ABC transporter ATP-binding protein [Bacteroidales bacterium]
MKQFLEVFSYIKPYWKQAGLNIFFNILSAIFALFSFTMAIPFLGILFETQDAASVKVPFEFSMDSIMTNLNYYMTQIVLIHGKPRALLYVSIAVVVVTFFKTSFVYLANYFIAPVRTGVERDIRNKIYSKVLRLPLAYYSEARKGDILSRISTDVKEVEISIMSSLEMLFRDPATIIIFLISMFLMSFQLTLMVLILLPISGFFIGRLGKKLKTTSFKGQKKMGFLLSVIEESLSGLRIIKAFNAEGFFIKKFRRTNEMFTMLQNKIHRRRYLAGPLSEFSGTVVMMILMFYGGRMVLVGDSTLSPEVFITFIIVFSQIINPAKSFSGAYFNLQKGLASMDRIGEILNAQETIVEKDDAIPISSFKELIQYDEVNFKYNTEPVLKNINLNIQKGQTIALVGQSGGGKSTLADLLPRFIEPQSGIIKIDGVSIDMYKIVDLRNLMGIVTQEPILFNDTFFNNIAFGLTGMSEEMVIGAAKVANAHDFIVDTPLGYQANIGERGNKLSGGQRQRISIARALLKNPPILILDEATSSLDTESEKLVQDAILKLMENRTSIVIAHRLSTIKNADEICVIQNGEIVERGCHRELIAKKGHYHSLHKLQVYD